MSLRSKCKYVPEIECLEMSSCIQCFKEEDLWVKRWVRYLKLRENRAYINLISSDKLNNEGIVNNDK
jgi:hypothetical protein